MAAIVKSYDLYLFGLGIMLYAERTTNINNPAVINFTHAKVLTEEIQKVTSSEILNIDQAVFLASLEINFTNTEAFFIEDNSTENNNLELIRTIRKTNKSACIFILITHSKIFSSIEHYIAGADHCLKLPREMQDKHKIISQAIGSSHWKSPALLFLDRIRLLICNANYRLEISYTEMIIIEALINAPEHVLSQDGIAKALDPNITFYDPRALEKTISRLRTKIKKIYNLELIISVRTYGYRLRRGTISR